MPSLGGLCRSCELSLAWQPHPHAVAQELHACSHHHVAGLQSAGDPDAVFGRSAESDRRLAHALVLWVDDEHDWRASLSVTAASGTTIDALSSSTLIATVAVMPSRMAGGGAPTAMRTAYVREAGSA